MSVRASYVLSVACAALAAGLVPVGRPVAIATAVGAAVVLFVEYARLEPAVRATTWQPVKHLAVLGGAVLLAAALIGRLESNVLRAAAVVLAASGGYMAATVVARSFVRRTRSILLAGDRLAIAQCVEHWAGREDTDIRGVCLAEAPMDASDRPGDVLGVPVVGDLTDAPRVAATFGVDEVVVAPGPLVTAYDVRRLSWALERTPVQVGVTAEVHGAAPHRLRPRLLGRRVVLSVGSSERPRFVRLVKAAVDRVVGALLLVLSAPMLGVLALLVRVDSTGPAVFRQVRTGARGETFTMYKLRTMCTDAESKLTELRARNEGAGPLFKLTDDPRITRIGRLLRKTSLDELPQLINVVRGEMSLVGPRPGLPREVEWYDDWVSRRLAIKPGMTGSWQVNGRSRLDWNDSVGLDLGYVDNWTLGGDLVIAGKTFKAVVQRDGAA